LSIHQKKITMKKTFIVKIYDFACDFFRSNFDFLVFGGYIIIIAVAIMANVNEYLLPVAPWEWFVGLHFIPKTTFSLFASPFLLAASIHLVTMVDKPTKKTI